jgi:hypothetical protein
LFRQAACCVSSDGKSITHTKQYGLDILSPDLLDGELFIGGASQDSAGVYGRENKLIFQDLAPGPPEFRGLSQLVTQSPALGLSLRERKRKN